MGPGYPLSAKNTKPGAETVALGELFNYRQARALAAEIAALEDQDPNLVFSDAMHVAVALALEDAGMANTRLNIAWMFERICPGEVREILRFRLEHPEDYMVLPMAGATEDMSPAEIAAASTLAENLTPAQLDAFFFSDNTGHA